MTYDLMLVCIHHVCIQAVVREQFAMRACLDDTACFDHDDPVGLEDRVKAMRDDQDGAAFHELMCRFFKE